MSVIEALKEDRMSIKGGLAILATLATMMATWYGALGRIEKLEEKFKDGGVYTATQISDLKTEMLEARRAMVDLRVTIGELKTEMVLRREGRDNPQKK